MLCQANIIRIAHLQKLKYVSINTYIDKPADVVKETSQDMIYDDAYFKKFEDEDKKQLEEMERREAESKRMAGNLAEEFKELAPNLNATFNTYSCLRY